MKKKLLMVLLLVSSILLSISCAKNNYSDDYSGFIKQEKSIPIQTLYADISELKDIISKNPENKTLKILLLKKYYDYDLTIAKANNVKPGNEPYLFLNENSDKAIILVHGLSGSPWETRELGEFLYNYNFTVYGVRLYAHGTTVEQLRDSEWRQWYNAVEDAYTNIKYYSQDIYVGGVSTGAALSLMLAENHPDIKAVISIAAPIYLNSKKSMFAVILKYFMPYSLRNLTNEEKPYYYDKHVVNAVEQLYDAIEVYRKNLPKIKQPVLIMQSTNDPTVFSISADIINRSISSKDKSLIWYNETKHVLTKGNIKETLFDDVLKFLQKN